MKICFIVNPTAGKGKGKKTAQKLQEYIKDLQVSYEIRYTEREKEAEAIARRAAQEGFKKIVAVGGDGTVYEVLNGMMGMDATLGVIPAGTGNDFARTMNISQDIREALQIILEGKESHIDCGQANGRYFINVASIGLDAEIVKETETIKRYISGTTAYIIGVLKTLLKFKHSSLQIEVDGQIENKDIMLVAVANGRYYGGGMKIAPMADVKDGVFDICIIHRISKWKILRLFPTIFSGKHIHVKEVKLYKGKNIKINGSQTMRLNLDGDIIGNTPVEFKLIPQALKVIIP